MKKLCLGLLFSVVTPLGLAAQQVAAGYDSSSSLPEDPSALIAAATPSGPSSEQVSAIPEQQASLTPEQQAPPPPPTPDQSSSQSTNAPAQTTPSSAAQQQNQTESEKELKQEESQRMLKVIPNFNTVISGHAAPLTSRQKYQLFFKSSVDPFEFAAAGVDAGVEQAENSYPEYGQGFKGFAKRYGASFADGFDGNFWGNAVLPSIFHQDPRYFRLGHGTVMHRILYSISTTVRTKGDNGHWEFNYSNLSGNFIGGAISNAYYPASDRGVALTLERGLTVSGEGTFGSLAVEFYPDVINHFRQRRLQRQAAAAGGATPQAVPKP